MPIGIVPGLALSAGLGFLQSDRERRAYNKAYDTDVGIKREFFEKNWANQREFAKHGIRWRVEDAIAAGIHPLAALGVNTASGSPVSIGGFAGRRTQNKGIGQIMDLVNTMMSAQIRSEYSRGDLLRSQKRLIDGQADIIKKPAEVVPGAKGLQKGTHQGYKISLAPHPDGPLVELIPSQEAQEYKTEGVGALREYAKEGSLYLQQRKYWKNPQTPEARKFWSWVMSIARKVEPDPGMVIRWNPDFGQLQMVTDDGQGRLFTKYAPRRTPDFRGKNYGKKYEPKKLRRPQRGGVWIDRHSEYIDSWRRR